MSDPKKKPGTPEEPDRAKMMRVLIPTVAIAVVIVLVAVIAGMTGTNHKTMSDGSDGTADDPAMKEVAPGVRVRDLKEGAGAECTPGAKVRVHYTGWLTDGSEFDTSKGAGRGPAEFSLSEVIPGWTNGLPGMKVGGVRKLVIAPEKGYGSQSKAKIPAGSTLIFEVELLDVFGGSTPTRPRRSPPPADLTRLFDGTLPTADDPGLKSLGGGLKYRDIKVGDGPPAPNGASVVMDYTGWLLSDGSVFDSSWKPNRTPLDMSLSGLIPGWQQGVPGMKVGGIRKLVIPADLAYGSDSRPGIPANSTLVFEIELLGLK